MTTYYPPGIPDSAFARGKVPMTPEEVRAIVMAKARLRPADRVLDIGAGTGSFTVEAALLCPRGLVLAVERHPEALALLRENIARFHAPNVTVIEGTAPEILQDLTPFDRIFLGGAGEHLADVLEVLPVYLRPGGRIVAQVVTLEAAVQILHRCQEPPWLTCELTQLAIARGVAHGQYAGITRLEPLSPQWVIAAGL